MQAYLSTAADDAIKGLIPLTQDELHSPDEKELYELLNRLGEERGGRSPVPDEALDSMSVTSPSSGKLSLEEDGGPEPESAEFVIPNDTHFVATPVLVVAASCIVALLALCCVGAALYIAELLRKSVFRSAWDILPHLEKNTGRKGGLSYSSRQIIKGGSSDSEKVQQVQMPGALVVTITTPQLQRVSSRASLRHEHGSHLEKEDASEPECGDGDDFDVDEKFFDAESPDQYFDGSQYGTPVSTPVDLPPGLPALAAAVATVAAVAVARGPAPSSPSSSPEMRQVPPTSSSPAPSAATRPTWSVRATEASALVHAQENHERERRRGMFAMPELDAALAMQLRPGLGIGADAAWLVRFVMALFGWCAVLMNGR